jgi:hypothetical protein
MGTLQIPWRDLQWVFQIFKANEEDSNESNRTTIGNYY